MDFSLITDEQLNYCVYAHVNKQNGKMYIGITNNRNKRWSNNGLRYKGCTHFYNAIQKYGWETFDHIVIIDNISLSMANIFEKELIKKYDSIKNGYNLKDGGDGGGQIRENHFKSKPLYQYDLYGSFVKMWSCPIEAEEFYNVKDLTKIANGTENRKMSVGYQWSYEYHDKIQPYFHSGNKELLPIYQYDIDGNFIKKWEYRIDAINKYGRSIMGCAYGLYKTSFGYRWSFDYQEKLSTIPKRQKKKTNKPAHNAIGVIQKSIDGTIIAKYPNATLAAQTVTNGRVNNSGTLLKACREDGKILYGYLWEFENQEVS